jgi:hypothetical protein
MPTQHNSPIYAGDRPEIDAGEFSSFRMADMADYLKACIATLRALGALIFGKSVSSTISFVAHPLDHDRVRCNDPRTGHTKPLPL